MTLRVVAAACAIFANVSAAEPRAEMPDIARGTKILFQGDSITDCDRGAESDLGHGYVAVVATKLRERYPELKPVILNRGISGNRIWDLGARWQEDAIDLKPDILSILIGVNDAASDVSLADFEAAYDALLVQTGAALPHARLVLCEPFTLILGPSTPEAERWRAIVRERANIVEKLATKHRAPFVRFQKVLDEAATRAPAEHWLPDGIHPTHAAHELLADEWIRTVAEFYR